MKFSQVPFFVPVLLQYRNSCSIYSFTRLKISPNGTATLALKQPYIGANKTGGDIGSPYGKSWWLTEYLDTNMVFIDYDNSSDLDKGALAEVLELELG